MYFLTEESPLSLLGTLLPQHQSPPLKALVVAVSAKQALVDMMDEATDLGIILSGCFYGKIPYSLLNLTGGDVKT